MTPFDTFDDFMWATGAVFWLIAICAVAGILVHIFHGLVCAFSLAMFRARSLRKGGCPVPVWHVIKAAFRTWWEMVGHENSGSNKIVFAGASWRGPFDFDEI